METKYYDGTKLLSMKDLDGMPPEIYITVSNRNAGKTTYFSRLLMNRFFKEKKKFCLLYRFNYELDDIASKFFKDIQRLFFPDYAMQSKKHGKGIYSELFIRNANNENSEFESCGYGVSINNSDQIKKYSHLFSDVDAILFDEFQSESGHYCQNEITKFLSVHTSIARGGGKQIRKVPVYMVGNQVTIINPYYVALGISPRFTSQTKFLRGKGFVLENAKIESASKAQKESRFNTAFKNSDYVAYSSENIYLNDSTAFIQKPKGRGKYIASLHYNGKNYALWKYQELGIIYCDDSFDKTFPLKIAITKNDHQINYVMLRSNDMFIFTMRYYFEKGCFRFKDLLSKETVLNLLSY